MEVTRLASKSLSSHPQQLVENISTWDGIGVHNSDNIVIENNHVANNSGKAGIMVFNSSDNIIKDNHIVNNQSRGIGLSGNSNNNTIQSNTITGNPIGIEFLKDDPVYGTFTGGNTQIHFNNIYGNTEWGILNNVEIPVDARLNWWGDASGPSGSVADPETGTLAAGMGDRVSTNVRFDPWLIGSYADPVHQTRLYISKATTTEPIGFRFIGTEPGKEYDSGLVLAPIAWAKDGRVEIFYRGTDDYGHSILFTAFANSRLDFCIGLLVDRTTRTRYIIYDPFGVE